MNPMLRAALAGAAVFAVTFASGYGLHSQGRPYGLLLMFVHKMVPVAAVVYAVITTLRLGRAHSLGTIAVLAAVCAAICVVATIGTGGALSALDTPPKWVTRAHGILPYLTAATTGLFLVARAMES